MIKFCFDDSHYHRETEMITLALRGCRYYHGEQGLERTDSFSDSFTLIFVKEGRMNVEVDGEMTAVHEGEVAVILPNRGVKMFAESKVSVYRVGFTCDPVSFMCLESACTVVKIGSAGAYKYVELERRCRVKCPDEQRDMALLGMIYDVLYSKRADGEADKLYESFKRYCDEHCHDMPDVQGVAAALGVSKDHLCRTVKRCDGRTCKEYIVGMKISMAEELLIGTGLTVSEIAESLGFYTVELFNKFMKYHTGKTPLKYREKA